MKKESREVDSFSRSPGESSRHLPRGVVGRLTDHQSQSFQSHNTERLHRKIIRHSPLGERHIGQAERLLGYMEQPEEQRLPTQPL